MDQSIGQKVIQQALYKMRGNDYDFASGQVEDSIPRVERGLLTGPREPALRIGQETCGEQRDTTLTSPLDIFPNPPII